MHVLVLWSIDTPKAASAGPMQRLREQNDAKRTPFRPPQCSSFIHHGPGFGGSSARPCHTGGALRPWLNMAIASMPRPKSRKTTATTGQRRALAGVAGGQPGRSRRQAMPSNEWLSIICGERCNDQHRSSRERLRGASNHANRRVEGAPHGSELDGLIHFLSVSGRTETSRSDHWL